MLPEKNKHSIDSKLIKEISLQIVKDFRLWGLEIVFSGDTDKAYDELFGQILPALDELINSNYHQFLSLLYQIDVSEKEVNTLIEEHSKIVFSEEITKLIIYREHKKVLTRYYFQEKRLKGSE